MTQPLSAHSSSQLRSVLAQPAASEASPLTVVGLEIDAFKRMRAARLAPSPHGLVPVRGRNAQGKSSLIEAMEAALRGAEALPDLPITDGQHGARVVVDLGEIVVRRTWKRDAAGNAKSALVVEGADGQPQKSPQAVLDALCGRFADPVHFLSLKPEAQVQAVLGVLGLDRELARLEAVAKEQFEARRDLGRDADRARKAVEQMTQEVGLFGLDQIPEAGNAEALAGELQAAKDHNAAVEAAIRGSAEAERAGKAARDRITRLKAELEQAQAELARHVEAWKAEQPWARTAPVDVAPIVAALGEIEEVQRRRTRIELLNAAQADMDAKVEVHAQADAALESIRGEIAALLGSVQFPVDGMAYDPDAKALKVNGIPFSQASHAERLKISAAIAMAGNPRIRVMFIREGSMLDQESLALVTEIAEQAGFQLWVEIVSSDKNGAGIWVEDGEAFMQEGQAKNGGGTQGSS